MRVRVRIHYHPKRVQIRSVAFHKGGKYFATGTQHSKLRIFDANSGEVLGTYLHGHTIRSIAFDPSGERVVTGAEENAMRIVQVVKRELVHYIEHPGRVRCVAFDSRGQRVASACLVPCPWLSVFV